jgi:hypothetical protein
MKTRGITLLCITALALSGCSSINVQTDWDRGADFSQLRTWSFAPEPQKETGVAAIDVDTLFTNRVRAAVSRVLPANGYTEVDGASEGVTPDFHVTFFPVVEDKTSVSTINDHYGHGYAGPHYGYHGGWGYGPGGFGTQTVVDQYQEGTLVIDIMKSGRGELIWRGSGTARLKGSTSPEKQTALVNKAVEQIFAGFPPGGGKKK